jgi:lysozyme
MTRGAYLFLRFPRLDASGVVHSAPAPADQAAFLTGILPRLSTGDLPPAIDVEFPGRGALDTGHPPMTPDALINGVVEAVGVIRACYRVWPMIYTSARVWEEDLANLLAPVLSSCHLWLGGGYPYKSGPAVLAPGAISWPTIPPPWGKRGDNSCLIHQYQGDATGLAGAGGTVDLNRWNVLARGCRPSRLVAWVQGQLRLPQTGDFDAATEAEVKVFQKLAGLQADGLVGPKTYARLWSPDV